MSEGPEPTPIDVPEHAIPATYRRAPRTERFIITGIGIGALIGFIVGVILPAGSGVGRGTAGLLVAIAGALAGGLVSGSQAAFMEYMSGRSADRQRRDIETDWMPILGVGPEIANTETANTETANTETANTETPDPETPDPETPDPETPDPETPDPEPHEAQDIAAETADDDERAGDGSR